jgi:hypothetical protein
MEIYSVVETEKTPSINFDLNKGELIISGNSIPENPIEFYEPLIKIIDNYILEPKQLTNITFRMNYINTSSSRLILDIIKKFEAINKNSNNVIISWIYEYDDQDMEDAGHDYQSLINLNFNLVPIKI